jgi:hypothetical protein
MRSKTNKCGLLTIPPSKKKSTMKTFLKILFFIFFFITPWGIIRYGWFYHLQEVEEAERKKAAEIMFFACESFLVDEYGDASRPYRKFYRQLHARSMDTFLRILLIEGNQKYIDSHKLEILKEMVSIHRKLLIDENCKCGDCKCGETMIFENCGCEKNNHKCKCNTVPQRPVPRQPMQLPNEENQQ